MRTFNKATRVVALILSIGALLVAIVIGGRFFWTVSTILWGSEVPVVTTTFASLEQFSIPEGVTQDWTTASNVDGYFSAATLNLVNLGWEPRLLLALGELLNVATGLTVAITIAIFAFRVWRGSVFTRGMVRALTILAVFVLLGPELARVFTNLGIWISLDQLDLQWPFVRVFELKLDTIGLAASLALLAIAFRIAKKFQYDSEGLV